MKINKPVNYQEYKPETINKMLNFAKVLAYSLSPDGKFVNLNEYVISESGYSAKELRGQYFWDFVHQDYKKDVLTFYHKQLNEKIEFTINEFPIISKEGRSIWMQQEVCAQFDDKGDICCFEVFGTVITERKKTELELKEIVDKHKRLMKEIPDGYYRLDLEGNLLEYNDALLTLIGHDVNSINGLNYRQLSSNPEISEFTKQAFNEVYKTKKRLNELEWELIKKNKDIIYVSTSISPIIDQKTDNVIGFEGILRDITERIKELKEMTSLATKDMLTGLYNRFWFIEFVKKDMAKSFRTKKGTASILFIDGNDFKEINDNLGHEAGDILLKNISNALIKSVRKTDIISRYGGDEFCIYLSESDSHIEEIIKKIIKNINKIPYKISIGCRTIDFQKESLNNINIFYDKILKEADNNLYAVKDMIKKKRIELRYNSTVLKISSSAFKIDDKDVIIFSD